jgi:hypothetical protein
MVLLGVMILAGPDQPLTMEGKYLPKTFQTKKHRKEEDRGRHGIH